MSDNAETTSSSNDQNEKETKSDTVNEVNTSTPIRLFGQFKQNGFGFNNLSPSVAKDKTEEQNPSSTYFTNTLAKISSSTTTTSTSFTSSSTPLAASLASLGANKPLFGGSSTTTPSSFTDLKVPKKTTDNNNDNDDNKDEDGEEEGEEEEEEEEKASLLESVAEYEAKRASTHSTTTIQGDTSTGEESEITKFQMTGKLFMYNPDQQQFVERGFGTLKINENHDPSDWDRLQARLIMRLDKAFRVILNSPIFPKMTVEKVTDRSVRFGAQDESHLRVFIIKASTIDCNNFLKELQSRIQIIERQQQISSTPTKSSNTSGSSDVIALDDTPPKENLSNSATRKRSHSQSDSDTSDKTNDISKKSKLVEGYREVTKDLNQSTSEEDSKSTEQEPAHS